MQEGISLLPQKLILMLEITTDALRLADELITSSFSLAMVILSHFSHSCVYLVKQRQSFLVKIHVGRIDAVNKCMDIS